jgi:hypothetical protein
MTRAIDDKNSFAAILFLKHPQLRAAHRAYAPEAAAHRDDR